MVLWGVTDLEGYNAQICTKSLHRFSSWEFHTLSLPAIMIVCNQLMRYGIFVARTAFASCSLGDACFHNQDVGSANLMPNLHSSNLVVEVSVVPSPACSSSLYQEVLLFCFYLLFSSGLSKPLNQSVWTWVTSTKYIHVSFLSSKAYTTQHQLGILS